MAETAGSCGIIAQNKMVSPTFHSNTDSLHHIACNNRASRIKTSEEIKRQTLEKLENVDVLTDDEKKELDELALKMKNYIDSSAKSTSKTICYEA